MRTVIYVDGFNLYYRALRGTRFKWLDLGNLFRRVLQPKHQIISIKYFTARVSETPRDPKKPIRQKTWLRALKSYTPEIYIYYGHFLTHRVKAPLATPRGNQRFVDIIKTEEKGSDVNGTYLSQIPGIASFPRKRLCEKSGPGFRQ